MRKFKNLVIGGIENKVFNLILLTLLLIAGVLIPVTIWQNNLLTGLSKETNKRQQEATEAMTDGIIDTVIRENMSRLTEQEAAMADEVFQDLEIRVRMMAEYATDLFAAGDAVPSAGWSPPDAALNGRLSAQVTAAEGVDLADPAVARPLGVIANMANMMISLCKAYDADSAYIALAGGATLRVNALSGRWIGEDGNPRTFDSRERTWYRQAAETGKLIFTEVYQDVTTGELCVTCAIPVYGPEGELQAVAGADMFLTEMRQTIQNSDSDGGYMAVVSQDGHVVFSPRAEGEFRMPDPENAADLRESGNEELASLVRDALTGKTDVRRFMTEEGEIYAVGAPLNTLGWTMIAVFDANAAGEPARKMHRQLEEIQAGAVETYQRETGGARRNILLILGGVLVLVGTGTLLLGKRIVRPLNLITKRISEISEENPVFKMEDAFRTGDEIEALAESFANISQRTVDYVQEVTRITAEKERIGTELHMAKLIQSSMLPHVFPAFPSRPEFDIYAMMDPAREVGGDFYDFFLIDDDHLALVIADVSGKGVPAALFMMISKVIIQSCAMLGQSAAEILTKTNEAICSNNQVEMFITVWVGILEISTGRLTASNAGHEFPTILHDGKGFELYRDRHGFVIGGLAGMKYREYEIQMRPGDKLFVYTDGVPEATSGAQELFGTDRMLAALNRHPEAGPQELLQNVRQAVDGFVQDAEQFDDLTMLCLEYRGPGKDGTAPPAGGKILTGGNGTDEQTEEKDGTGREAP